MNDGAEAAAPSDAVGNVVVAEVVALLLEAWAVLSLRLSGWACRARLADGEADLDACGDSAWAPRGELWRSLP